MPSTLARAYGFVRPIGESTPRRHSLETWYRQLLLCDQTDRHDRRVCLATGVALQLLVVLICVGTVQWLDRVGLHRSNANDRHIAIAFGSAISGFMLFLAAFVKPEGRAEAAGRYLEEGLQAAAQQGGEPVSSALILALMMIALYGGFAIVEALRRAWVSRRLAGVDRIRAARVMSELANSPVGLSATQFGTIGESEASLRGILALLILQGRIEIRDGLVTERGPARRAMLHRHPLAEVFVNGF